MKKTTQIVIVAVITLILVLLLSPGSFGISTNLCSPCHNSYSQYLDIVEENSANQVPKTLDLGETKTVLIAVKNLVNTDRYAKLSRVSITLSSVNGHFSVKTQIYNIGDMPVGTVTASWQITGVSDGYDFLKIEVAGYNTHFSVSFSDIYNPYPLVAVGNASGTPPTPPSPAPSPSPSPAPSPAPTPAPKPKPTPSPAPSPTPTPAPSLPPKNAPPSPSSPVISNQSPLSIFFSSPTEGQKFEGETTQILEWNSSGGTKPLNVTLEYQISSNTEKWTFVATNLAQNGSFAWIVPKTPSVCFIRATVSDSASATQIASKSIEVEIIENSKVPSVIPMAFILIGVVSIVAIFLKKSKKFEANTSFPKSKLLPEKPFLGNRSFQIKKSRGFEKLVFMN